MRQRALVNGTPQVFEASVLETPKVQCMQKQWYVFWNLRAWFWASQTQKLLHGTGLPDLGVPRTWQRLHEGVSATTICCHAPEFTRMIILEVINQLFISEARQERKHVVPELQHKRLCRNRANQIASTLRFNVVECRSIRVSCVLSEA